jgi:hypothetical protein
MIQATAQNKVIKHYLVLCIHANKMFSKLYVKQTDALTAINAQKKRLMERQTVGVSDFRNRVNAIRRVRNSIWLCQSEHMIVYIKVSCSNREKPF